MILSKCMKDKKKHYQKLRSRKLLRISFLIVIGVFLFLFSSCKDDANKDDTSISVEIHSFEIRNFVYDKSGCKTPKVILNIVITNNTNKNIEINLPSLKNPCDENSFVSTNAYIIIDGGSNNFSQHFLPDTVFLSRTFFSSTNSDKIASGETQKIQLVSNIYLKGGSLYQIRKNYDLLFNDTNRFEIIGLITDLNYPLSIEIKNTPINYFLDEMEVQVKDSLFFVSSYDLIDLLR